MRVQKPRGVRPSLSFELILILACSSSSFTPLRAAQERGVLQTYLYTLPLQQQSHHRPVVLFCCQQKRRTTFIILWIDLGDPWFQQQLDHSLVPIFCYLWKRCPIIILWINLNIICSKITRTVASLPRMALIWSPIYTQPIDAHRVISRTVVPFLLWLS